MKLEAGLPQLVVQFLSCSVISIILQLSLHRTTLFSTVVFEQRVVQTVIENDGILEDGKRFHVKFF